MKAFTTQNLFVFVCLSLIFGSQISLALQSITNPEEQTNNGIKLDFSSQRSLATITASCSSYSYCARTGDLTSDSSVTYIVNMDKQSTMRLSIRVGEEDRDVTLNLQATTPINNMETSITLWPSDSWPSNLVPTLSGTSWQVTTSLGSSPFSLRELDVTIDNPTNLQTKITLTINITSSDDENKINLAWLIPLVIVGALSMLFFVLIWIRQIRRRKATAARLANIQVAARQHNESSLNLSQQPLHTYPQGHDLSQFQPQYYSGYPQPMAQPIAQPISGVQMGVPFPNNTGPLSAANFDSRFPENLAQNIFNFSPQQACPLCYQNFMTNPRCRQLTCGHVYHSDCIKPYLLNQLQMHHYGACPGCNTNLTY